MRQTQLETSCQNSDPDPLCQTTQLHLFLSTEQYNQAWWKMRQHLCMQITSFYGKNNKLTSIIQTCCERFTEELAPAFHRQSFLLSTVNVHSPSIYGLRDMLAILDGLCTTPKTFRQSEEA